LFSKQKMMKPNEEIIDEKTKDYALPKITLGFSDEVIMLEFFCSVENVERSLTNTTFFLRR